MPDAGSDEPSGIAPRNEPPTQNAMDMEQRTQSPHDPNSEGVVDDAHRPTQEELQGKKRLRWTEEMNEYLYRTYLTITKMETLDRPYSVELHQSMTDRFPELRNKTRQNILDQRRQLFTKNRLNIQRVNEIRREVETELGIIQPNEQNYPQTTNNANEETNNSDSKEDETRFEKNYTMYRGMDPLSRPRLPRLKTNKDTPKILSRINTIIARRTRDMNNLNDFHDIIYAAATTVLEAHEQKVQQGKQNKNVETPRWQTRIERKIEELRRAIGQLHQFTQINTPTNRLRNKVTKSIDKYKDNDNQTVQQILDKLKQKLMVYSHRIKRYRESYLRKQQNNMFHTNQKHFYRSLMQSDENQTGEIPPPQEAINYWSNLWENPKTHNRKAKWLTQEKKSTEKIQTMIYDTITEQDVKKAITNTHNWKAPGPDGIHNYWLKKFNSTHHILAKLFTHMMQDPEEIPPFLTTGVTYLLPKSNPSSRDPTKYRPITCLPTVYKILTSILYDQIYQHLNKNHLLPEEQKGCKRGSRGCKEQLTIDMIVTEEAKKKKKDLYVAYIDYKKAFDSVPHSLLVEMLKIYKISPVIVNLLEHLMPKWKTNLKIQREKNQIDIGKVHIKRGIFQGDALSALWYCITLAPLSKMLNRRDKGYKLQNGIQIDHLAYMDDIKLIAATKEGLNTLLDTIKKYTEDTGMEFGLDKCKISAMKRGEWEKHPGFELDTERIITAMTKEDGYEYLGLDQARGIKHNKMKEITRKKLLERVKIILKTQLSAKNKVQALNSYAIPTITYTFGVIKWSETNLMDLNREIRVLFTRNRARHPKSSVERFYIPRMHGGRGVMDLKEAHQKQLDNLRKFFYEKGETSDYHEKIAKADHNLTPLNLADKNLQPLTEIKTLEQRTEEWKSKQLHGRHPALLESEHIDKEASNVWLKNGNLFAETEGFMMGIQDQVIPTLNYRKYIMNDETIAEDKCRLCHNKSETINHIVAGCTILAPTEYLKRHDNLAKVVHQELCKNTEMLTEIQPYYKYTPDSVKETCTYKIYWNRPIQTDHTIQHNKPDIVLQDKINKTTYIIDIAVPAAHNIAEKQSEKIRKYLPLAAEIKTLWKQDTVTIIPIVVGATGEIPIKLHKYLEKLSLAPKLYYTLQKLAIMGTCHIVRKTLNMSTF